jgi:hypothetical protein
MYGAGVNRRIVLPVLLLVANGGCEDKKPARIESPSDTLVVNTTTVDPLDVHVVDRKGAVIPAAAIDYSTDAPDSILMIRGGRAIQCRNDGTARVMLESGKLRSSVTVRCDIIDKIEAAAVICTQLGDPPIPLSVSAFDRDGNAVPAPRLYVTADSLFVRISNGLITPLRAGDGDIGYTNGRRRSFTLLRVLDSAANVKSDSRFIHARDSMFTGVCR